ncbi:peptidase T [Paenibacillus sp. YIM B09110]|uniref:peptidase T n=1 Tax=Paenibacillus sp. YIM B09110 TaxID=3126102 RepID=UPI00301BC012
MKSEIINRFVTYAKVDTQSNESYTSCPSTPGQLTLARMLVEELKTIGMQEITLDDNGYVMATLPANSDKPIPTIGFLAHVDTATELSGANVKPQVVEAYDGGDITLNDELRIVLSPSDFPELAGYKGQTLITTDGTTLLGADDKAGIAEIMTAMNYLIQHPEVKHGRIRIAFTPDEEIGRGPHKFDVTAFDASYAYTLDGGPLGELQFESFNAAAAAITIKGKNVHPGTAKGKMINAVKIAVELQSKLPVEEAPEHTEGYEGFFHLSSIQGDVEEAQLRYLIRDHDRERFNGRKAELTDIVETLKAKYGADRIELELRDQYFNMGEKIEPVKEIVDIARQAMERLGITPIIQPIRGGTDGSQLSYMGLPTPNIFTGGENYHGRYEYVSVDSMLHAVNTIIEIVKLYEENA